MKLRYKFGILLSGLLIAFGLGRCGRGATAVYKPAAVLPLADNEQIRVDPSKHTISILTSSGQKTLTLPDRPSTFDVLKNGTVRITSSQFGLEHHPFFGVTVSDNFRIGFGLDALYYKKLDIGAGVADRMGSYTPVVFAKVTYNVWSNCQAGITYDNKQHIGLALTVRL